MIWSLSHGRERASGSQQRNRPTMAGYLFSVQVLFREVEPMNAHKFFSLTMAIVFTFSLVDVPIQVSAQNPADSPMLNEMHEIISAGGFHTCGLKSDGTLACWGNNWYNQSIPPDGIFTKVSAGGYHTCGVKSDGTLACWGYNTDGQSTPPPGTFLQVSAGDFDHTCGVRSKGTLLCWGNNSLGKAVPPAGIFTQVSVGQ